ncbi:MAG: tetratricopeptide repeat protein, partial [Acidobacteria bacterium]|nr:tetratricopeptide repeat protein [Acidobacteriota bacterium]
ALEAFDRVLAKDTLSAPARFGRAASLQLLKRYDEALAEYDKVPADAELRIDLTKNCLAAAAAQRDVAGLKRYGQKLLDLDSESGPANEALGVAALMSGDFKAAVGFYESAIAAGVEGAEVWAGLGTAEARGGNDQAAEAAFRRALELQPNHAGSLFERAALEDRRGTAADARREWEKAAAGTRSEAAYWNLALAAQRQGDQKAAIEALQRLVAVSRQRHDAWYLLGELLSEDARPAEAAKAFAEALRIKPDWLDAQFNFGLLAWRAGHLDRAWQAFESAATRQPERSELHEAMAQLAVERGDANRAADALKKLDRRGGGSETLNFNVAVALQRVGRARDAEAIYRRSVSANPSFVEGLVNLGHALEAQGDRDGAAECWQKAVALRPELAR